MVDKELLDYFDGDEMSANVWLSKYAMKDASGNIIEKTPDDMHRRMAKYFANVEESYEFNEKENVKLKLSNYGYSRTPLTEDKIYSLFKDFKYVVPGGSVMAGLGSPMPVSLSNCFIAGTKVLTKDGFKNIEDVKKGEFVLSDDGNYHEVAETMVRDYNGDLYKFTSSEILEPIVCTPNHKFLTNHGWKRADRILAPHSEQIHVCDRLKTAVDKGKNDKAREIDDYAKIETIEIIEGQSTKVYNLSVKDTHTYNVNGVICHNCWVIKGPDDSLNDIFRVCNEQSQLFKRRGGVGFDISKLRPNGATVHNSAKTTTGPVSFMEMFSNVTNTIGQSGRRGALMISMHIDHPDAGEFIEKKQDLTKVTGANVSVQIGDDFMEAVINDGDYIQRWPIECHDFNMNDDDEYNVLYESKTNDGQTCYYKKIKAKELWNKLVHCAWNTAEPGILFKDRHYNYSPDGLYPQFRGSSTNPCLVGDTLISTKEGDKTIKEIVEMVNNGESVEVYTYNEDSKEVELKNVELGMLTRENANVIELELEDGTTIKLTPDHKVFTENRGWVEASKLTESDVLVLKSKHEILNKIKIDVINDAKNEDVYDLNVRDNHNFFANGILVHNCGEIFMHEDSCRLIHVNVASFIQDPFTKNARIDDESLYEVFYETTRLGDDLVDLEANGIRRILDKISSDGDEGGNEYKLYERLLKNTLRGRRCGVGFFGLSDAVAKLGYKFDSKEGLSAIRHIMKVMFTAELDSETDMAITRGAFNDWNPDIEKQSNGWYKMLEERFPKAYSKMMTYGRRNVSFGTAAPTGSVAMLSHVSSGIEPVFMPYYTRRVKCTNKNDRVDFIDRDGEKFTEYINVHPTLKEWASIVYNEDTSEWNEKKWESAYKNSPWFGSTANDIDWTKRVEIQGIVQEYITHSISSTCNLPNNVTESRVSQIYMESWKNGLKGITVYRDGCRSGVIVSTKKEEDKSNKICLNNTVKRRPKSLDAKIIRFSNNGEKWVGIVGLLDGKPYELFTGMLEKLNIPQWVESGSIIKNHDEVIDEETGEVKKVSRYDLCYKDNNNECVCVDGISRIFNPEFWNYGKLISGLLRHNMPITYIIKVIKSLKMDDSTINTWKNGVVRALNKFSGTIITEEKCPECGGRMVRENGCIHCIDCGYSKCS